MSVILIALDEHEGAAPVLDAGCALAEVLGATPRAVHVREGHELAVRSAAAQSDVAVRLLEGEPVAEIVAAVADPEVAVGVMGARGSAEGPRPVGHTARAVLEQVDKPVLAVPPDARPAGGGTIRRVLVPLEGTAQSTDAVTPVLCALAAGGAVVVPLHVFDVDSVPRFWDQAAHAGDTYATEFLTRWCGAPSEELHLRRGRAPETIVEAARRGSVDLITLGWSQDLSPGRAAIVRAALDTARIPILLVPTRPGALTPR
jgi:nucleotide-binding universal stress UspA family protein